jgi:hypothetical protein
MVAVLAAGVVLSACFAVPSEPGGKGQFAVIATPIDEGWTLMVPVCADDVISSVTLTSDGGSGGVNPQDQVSYRWAKGVTRPQRLVELTITRRTVDSGTLNPDEIREVSSLGRLDIEESTIEIMRGDEAEMFGGPLRLADDGPTLLDRDGATPFSASTQDFLTASCGDVS